MKILVTGATGTAGAEVVRQAILDSGIETVTALVRKPLAISHPKLRVVLHDNFLDYSSVQDLLSEQSACLWCLGISQNRVTKEEYHTITYEYAMNAARALLQANPESGFMFLSGAGADSSEKRKLLFARVKGKTENGLNTLGFKRLCHFRPGYIHSTDKQRVRKPEEKFFDPLAPLFYRFLPNMIISTVELAKAMIYGAKHGTPKRILENNDIRQIAGKS